MVIDLGQAFIEHYSEWRKKDEMIQENKGDKWIRSPPYQR
jgi:hypothetical protein